MKVYSFLLMFLLSPIFAVLYAQQNQAIPVQSRIQEVTVYLKGARVTRMGKAHLSGGDSRVVFKNLSPFVDPKSIRVEGDGNFMIKGVRFEHDFHKETPETRKYKQLLHRYDSLRNLMEQTDIAIKVIDQQIEFLNKNNKIGGKTKITVQDLQSVGNYYAAELKKLQTEKWKLNKQKKLLEKKWQATAKEIQKKASLQSFPPGEIFIETRSGGPVSARFKISYQVKHAGWYPSYEIHAMDDKHNIHCVYQAQVYQQTQVDWKDVALTLSSGNPSTEIQLPQPSPMYVGRPLPDDMVVSDGPFKVEGTVRDAESGEPLPGVNIMVKGTTIGTTTDFDGKYKLKVPGPEARLEFSYVGYQPVEITAKNKAQWNVYMKQGEHLQAVVVDISGTKREVKTLAYSVQKVKINNEDAEAGIRGAGEVKEDKPRSIMLPVETVENATSVEFRIRKPYSVPSGQIPVRVEVNRYDIPAEFMYQSVPYKIPSAFLTAIFTNTEKYKLLPGEAMVFSGKTYLGKTLLMPHSADDTLSVSLGVEPAIAIQRTPLKDYTRKRLLGNKVIEERQWIIKVKNNKSEPVKLKIYDRIPVSNISSVDVETLELSGGRLDKDTGIVSWTLKLAPGKSKKIRLGYRVKYPSYMSIQLE